MNYENIYNNKEKKKYLEDYEYCIGSSKQACAFEGTTNYIMSHVLENFESDRDVAEALRTLSPLVQVSEAEYEAVHDR